MNTFKEIKTRNELADFLGFSHSQLTYILYVKKPDSFYTTFETPKKNGGTRVISAPSGALKKLQQKLAAALWEHLCATRAEKQLHLNISHAFEKRKSIITNAAIHRNKRYVLNIDLKDFFPSFHFGRVAGYFEKNNDFLLPKEVATVLAQITCFNGALPQGAPTSPIISNLICQILDMRLLKIAKKYRLDYTRYADDLTFSTNFHEFSNILDDFLRELTSEITKAGFTINSKKTRLLFKDSRQEVTGLVVNQKINVPRAYYKQTKAMAHSLYTTGSFTVNGSAGTLDQLEGRFTFIDQLDHYNNQIDSAKHNAHCLSGREKEYQAFLFYRTFFANPQPLIITEGKTDVRYIEAALKNQYQKYPNLIQKGNDGTFSFNISFFHRSHQWNYFYDLSLDGADALKILYRYFTGNTNTMNYYEYFRERCNCVQKFPIIFLFDNETKTKRPLCSFLRDNPQISGSDKDALQNDLYINLKSGSKLFLMTNPLVGDREECEIEDLFSPDLLAIRLNGKTFCRDGKFDGKNYFGKEYFSKYVSQNFESIDFSGFTPLLDALNTIVSKAYDFTARQ